MQRIQVIDSHTGGEPTRLIVAGGPELGNGSMADRLMRFRNEWDHIRSAVVNEPRGSDVLVGGLICESVDSTAAAGIIFFNNTGYLGMCGHGTIGLLATLKHLGRVGIGEHKIETPVGVIKARLYESGTVDIENVDSLRLQNDVTIDVPDYGEVVWDVAWGGNWFFLVKNSWESLEVANAEHLRQVALWIREALVQNGITGSDGANIDHIEIFGAAKRQTNDSRNFVLCPGGAYDRSPCGTGTSAKLACLAADGKLAPGEVWRQESIVGSVFSASYQPIRGTDRIVPTISGEAFISGEATLILDPNDPFCNGIRQ
jgi:4-hydroxyproline epimerase